MMIHILKIVDTENFFFFSLTNQSNSLNKKTIASQIARRLIILGAPGSGKGTIASRIVKTYSMPYIVVGDLLRQNIQQKTGN